MKRAFISIQAASLIYLRNDDMIECFSLCTKSESGTEETAMFLWGKMNKSGDTRLLFMIIYGD